MSLFGTIFKSNSDSGNEEKKTFWHVLSQMDQIETLIEESKQQPVLLFKHSTRCSISSMVLSQFERSYTAEPTQLKSYLLDLLAYRELSNALATQFNVDHQSPQVLVIKDGVCIYDASHNGIQYELIEELL